MRVHRSIRRNDPLIILAVALALMIVLGVALAARLRYVHDKTWEYSLFPSSTPPKVVFGQRDYSRDDYITKVAVPPDFVRSGQTMGGGAIYAPPERAYAPTVIDVVDGPRTVEYSLMGGP